MTQVDFEAIKQGNIEALEQALNFINQLTDEQYSFCESAHFQSSIGQHIRHVIDMFSALFEGFKQGGVIDYDQRRRGAAVETQRSIALAELAALKQATHNMLPEQAAWRVEVKTEVTFASKSVATFPSTLMRELVFTAAHAVHHFALIRMIASFQNCQMDEHFGLAPATSTFLRQA